MTTISKVNVSARNADINNLTTRIIKEFAKNDWSSDGYLTPILEELTELNADFTKALNRLAVYSQLAEQDEVRDEAIRALFYLVDGYSYIPIDEMKEAATLLNNVLSQYGLTIQHEDYSAESAKIDSLLVDLARPKLVEAIAKLNGVAENIASLAAAQEEFERIAMAQAEMDVAKDEVASASVLKMSVAKRINGSLVEYMNVMSKVDPDRFAATAANMAEFIDQTNELAKRRSKKPEDDLV